jgi:hypothetical protein
VRGGSERVFELALVVPRCEQKRACVSDRHGRPSLDGRESSSASGCSGPVQGTDPGTFRPQAQIGP